MHDSAFTRRLFLQRGCMLASIAATIPSFIERSALATLVDPSLVSQPGIPDERILVVVQLGGGNDGLNTVVPYGNPDYYRLRPQLAVRDPRAAAQAGSATALELSRDLGIGLHPSLTGFKELFDGGELSVVQGVGYPNPNRSHFSSMDIWHTGTASGKGTGWLGRYFDCTCNGTPVADGAIAMGASAPLAMQGDVQKPVAFENSGLFRWSGQDVSKTLVAPYDAIGSAGILGNSSADTQRNFLMRTALDAQVASDRIRRAVAKKPLVAYPAGDLSRQLQMVGAMIREGLPTRVYYASMSGFDTHGGQLRTHANLLKSMGDAVAAFQRDLRMQGNDRRVLTLVFSEFGRRVKQNASGGTDHGTAAPVFLVGPNAKAGVHGVHPSLVDLDQGDLKFGTDFRSVYASILEDWLKAPSADVLRGSYANAKVVRTA